MADSQLICLVRVARFAVLAIACSSAPPPKTPSDEAQPELPASPAEAPLETESAPSTPAPGPAPNVAAAAPIPNGPRDSRTKEAIQSVIASNRDKVRACYDAALAHNPGIQGDLVVTFVINPNGSVKQAEVNWAESEVHVPELDTCAADALKTLKFPVSSRGLESKVNYPFNFNPPDPNKPAKPANATKPE